MQILIQHRDGTQTVLYEVGDRVRFTRNYKTVFFDAALGEVGTVSYVHENKNHPSLSFVSVKPESWGPNSLFNSIPNVPPWFVELVK